MDTNSAQLKEMISLIFNYRASVALFTANQMEVFDKLAKGPATAEEIAAQCGSIPHHTELLLNACVAIGLLEKEENRFRNSPMAQEFLLEDSPTCLKHQVALQTKNLESSALLYEAMYKPRPVAAQPPSRDDLEGPSVALRAFEEAAFVLGKYLPTYIDLTGCQKMLTIGGPMPGTLTIRIVQKTPGLQATVLSDSETEVKAMKKLIEKHGLTSRIAVKFGDLLQADFGQDNDAIMQGVALQRTPEVDRILFKRCFDALRPGGLIYLTNYMTNPGKTSPMRSALWSLGMLTKLPAGEAYSTDELIGWLSEAGFTGAEVKDQPEPHVFRGIIAKKPA